MDDKELRGVIREELSKSAFVTKHEVEQMIDAKLDARMDMLQGIATSVDTYLRTAESRFGEWGAKLVESTARYEEASSRQQEAYAEFRQASQQFQIAAAKLQGTSDLVSGIRSDVEQIEERMAAQGSALAGLQEQQKTQDESIERIRRGIYGNPPPDGAESIYDMIHGLNATVTTEMTAGLSRIEDILTNVQQQVDVNTRFRTARMAIENAVVKAPIQIGKAFSQSRLGQSMLWLFTSRLGWLTLSGIIAILMLMASEQPVDLTTIIQEIDRALSVPPAP